MSSSADFDRDQCKSEFIKTDSTVLPTTDQYWIPDGIHLCQTPDGLVFLDQNTNRYSGLDLASSAAIASRINGLSTHYERPQSPDDSATMEIASVLERQGLLRRNRQGAHSFSPIQLPEIDIDRSIDSLYQSPPIRWHHIANFVVAWSGIKLRLAVCRKSGHLRILTERSRLARSRDRRTNPDTLAAAGNLFCIFQTLRAVVSGTHDQCLPMALALRQFLWAYGIRPTLVIGVRSRPFLAHAWIQVETLALDIAPDSVDPLIPIFAKV